MCKLICTSSKVELWPQSFVVEIEGQRPLLPQFIEWLKTNKPPMCMFMPDRLLDPNTHKANQIAFEHLVDTLTQNQSVSSPEHRM